MSDQASVGPAVPTSSLAVTSLVFGILAWCVLPFVGAIVAIVCGHLARAEIRNTSVDRRPEGDGLAVAGLVLGYVQLALCLLVLLMVIAAVIFGVALSHWR